MNDGVERTNTEYDTREKLEADIWKNRINEVDNRGFKFDVKNDDDICAESYDEILSWLDRQAVITERSHDVDRIALDELRRQRDELTAERDQLREAVDALEAGTMYEAYRKVCFGYANIQRELREVCEERDRLQRVVRIQADSFKALEREIAVLKADSVKPGQ